MVSYVAASHVNTSSGAFPTTLKGSRALSGAQDSLHGTHSLLSFNKRSQPGYSERKARRLPLLLPFQHLQLEAVASLYLITGPALFRDDLPDPA